MQRTKSIMINLDYDNNLFDYYKKTLYKISSNYDPIECLRKEPLWGAIFSNTKFVYDFVLFSFECHLMYQWQFSSNIWILCLRHLMNKWQFSFNLCLSCLCTQTELVCIDKKGLFVKYVHCSSPLPHTYDLAEKKKVIKSKKKIAINLGKKCLLCASQHKEW